MLFAVCPPGAQSKVPPVGFAVAVKVTAAPGQKVTGAILTVGLGATVTVPAVLKDAQPLSV
jgi:hypothetical protein